MAAENWPAVKLHVELVYFWFAEFSISHMVQHNGLFNLTTENNLKAFINKDDFINKDIFIHSQLVNIQCKVEAKHSIGDQRDLMIMTVI